MKSVVGSERALIPRTRTNALIMKSVKQVLRYLCAQGGGGRSGQVLMSLTPGRRLGWGGPGLRRGGWILWLDPAREGALGSGGAVEPEPGFRTCDVV